MTTVQKIIKYAAFALAAILILAILSTVTSLLSMCISIGNTNKTQEITIITSLTSLPLAQENFDHITQLEISTAEVNVYFCDGETFDVKTNCEDISVRTENDTLSIIQKSTIFPFSLHHEIDHVLLVTIPADHTFTKISIDHGTGQINLQTLRANNITLNLGAGICTIETMIATERAKIDTGIGRIEIQNGTLHHADIDLGVGETLISASLTGNSQIDCGIGKTALSLHGTAEDYTVNVDKGIGSVQINQNDVKDGIAYGNGTNQLTIEGGIGTIDVQFVIKNQTAQSSIQTTKRISQTRYRKYLISYKSKKQVNGIEIDMTIYNQKATETPRRNARGRLLFILFLIMLFKLSCFFHLRVNISERQKCQTLIVIQRVLYIPFALEQKIVVLVKILHPFALE